MHPLGQYSRPHGPGLNPITCGYRHIRLHCCHNGILGSQPVVKARVGAVRLLATAQSHSLHLIHETRKQRLCKSLDPNVS